MRPYMPGGTGVCAAYRHRSRVRPRSHRGRSADRTRRTARRYPSRPTDAPAVSRGGSRLGFVRGLAGVAPSRPPGRKHSTAPPGKCSTETSAARRRVLIGSLRSLALEVMSARWTLAPFLHRVPRRDAHQDRVRRLARRARRLRCRWPVGAIVGNGQPPFVGRSIVSADRHGAP